MNGEFRTIEIISKTYGRYELLVSPEKYRLLADGGPKWRVMWCEATQTFYAHRTIRLANGKGTTQQAHRVVTNCPPDLIVDHRNHNGMDCRDENLRICTNAQNSRNR